MVPPITAAVPDVVSMLEKINTSSGSWYTAIELANGFLSIPVNKVPRGNLLSTGKTSNTLSLS